LLKDLCFTDDEVVDIAQRYNDIEPRHGAPVIMVEDFRLWARLSDSHPGILRASLVNYRTTFQSRAVTPAATAEFFTNYVMKRFGAAHRSLSAWRELSCAGQQLLRSVYGAGMQGFTLGPSAMQDLRAAATKLVKEGVVICTSANTDGPYNFSSPLMEMHFIEAMKRSHRLTIPPSSSLSEFCREVILSMEGNALRNSLAMAAEGSLLEHEFQLAFYE
jgi:hypothetical protein